MIPELRYRWFISLSEKAKQLPKSHAIKKSHKPKLSKKSHAPIHHLTLKNQRRIKRLREKKESDTHIVKLLRKEAQEHKMTRDQLRAAIEYIKHEHNSYKEKVQKTNTRMKLIKELKEQLSSVRSIISALPVDDPESIKLQSQVLRIDKLIKQKEFELDLE